MRIEIVDLGAWGAATLVSEYDPHDDAIRINARAVDAVRRALGDGEADRFTTVAIEHERYHRAFPRATEADAHAHAGRTTGIDPHRYDAILRARDALFVGIDGGQSSTVALLGDASTKLARGSGPPADLVGEPRDSARQRDAIGAALDLACDAAHVARSTRVRALVAGISGFDAGLSSAPDLQSRAERVRIVHDTEIAHAGALDGAVGIVVIAGTGSVALGNDVPESFVRAGGWGYVFGDEGSALWIARTALRRAMLRVDRGEPSNLAERACIRFGLPSLRAIQHAVAHGELSRPLLAVFARDVLEAAAAGDRDGRAIRDAAAAELVSLVATVDGRLEPASWRLVSYAGGVFGDPAFVDTFGTALTETVPHANLVPPAGDPVDGALVLARRLG